MGLLDTLRDPDDVRRIPAHLLGELAAQIRASLGDPVLAGDHPGSHLGVVELSIGRDVPVIAVVGDGSLADGPALQALSRVGQAHRKVIVVLGDADRTSAAPPGGLARHLDRVADRRGYRAVVARLSGDDAGFEGGVSPAAVSAASGTVASERMGLLCPLGFTYLGPVDTDDVPALERALAAAADCPGPAVVYCRASGDRGSERGESARPRRPPFATPSGVRSYWWRPDPVRAAR